MKYVAILLLLLLLGPLGVLISGKVKFADNWSTANRQSAHLAPDPATHPQAIIQVYAARAFGWRGLFAVHMWLAVKPQNAKQYTVYQVVGWNKYRAQPVLVIRSDIPDRLWFNQRPWVVFQLEDATAQAVIPAIAKAAAAYPYSNTYRLWPGPNSNTFIAYLAREVPQLDFVMPALAIGKDFLPHHHFFAEAPDGAGYQFSVYGLFGVLISKNAGLEVNLLGLVVGVNPFQLAIAWPGVGWVGF